MPAGFSSHCQRGFPSARTTQGELQCTHQRAHSRKHQKYKQHNIQYEQHKQYKFSWAGEQDEHKALACGCKHYVRAAFEHHAAYLMQRCKQTRGANIGSFTGCVNELTVQVVQLRIAGCSSSSGGWRNKVYKEASVGCKGNPAWCSVRMTIGRMTRNRTRC